MHNSNANFRVLGWAFNANKTLAVCIKRLRILVMHRLEENTLWSRSKSRTESEALKVRSFDETEGKPAAGISAPGPSAFVSALRMFV
jgi:hypothetical protein